MLNAQREDSGPSVWLVYGWEWTEEWVIVREAALKAFLEGYNLFFSTCWLYPGYLCVFLPW